MWPTAFALTKMTAAEEEKNAALVKKAVSLERPGRHQARVFHKKSGVFLPFIHMMRFQTYF